MSTMTIDKFNHYMLQASNFRKLHRKNNPQHNNPYLQLLVLDLLLEINTETPPPIHQNMVSTTYSYSQNSLLLGTL